MARARTTFGERMKDARKASGWTQARLASRMGVTVDTIRRWESGQAQPKVDDAVAIAQWLGVDGRKLVGV